MKSKGYKMEEEEVELEDQQEVVAEDETSAETDEVVAEEDDTITEEEVETYDIDDDVNALLGGEELSEEFKAKAKTIFETALKTKVAEVRKLLEQQYEEKLGEEIIEAKEGKLMISTEQESTEAVDKLDMRSRISYK